MKIMRDGVLAQWNTPLRVLELKVRAIDQRNGRVSGRFTPSPAKRLRSTRGERRNTMCTKRHTPGRTR